MDRLLETSLTFLTLLTELVILFVGVSFAVTLLTRWIGLDRVGEWMGGGPILGALKGMALGFLTPFCTYSAIPMLVGLRRANVRISASVGFLLAAPILDPLLFAAFAVLFSVEMALAYTAITFVGVLAVAVLADVTGVSEFRPLEAFGEVEGAGCATEPVAAESVPTETASAKLVATEKTSTREDSPEEVSTKETGEGAACGISGKELSTPGCEPEDSSEWEGWREESKSAFWEGVELTRSMVWHIVGAVAIAALVMGYLPDGLLLEVAGPGQPFAIPAAALVGVPFYISVEALAPVGAALASKGMGLGAVFALTVAGAGVNIPEFALLAKIITRRGMIALVGAVFTVAVVGGYVMEVL